MRKHYKLNGSFALEVVDGATHRVERSLPLKNNLILNQGKNYVAQRSFVENILYCAVGTGTTPPLLTDTGLSNEAARTGDVATEVTTPCETTLVGAVYSLKKTFKFGVQASPLAIGEIGWSYTATAGANLFSKSLIIDEQGNTTVIVLAPGKYLRVAYTLQITIGPSTSQSGDAGITGWTAPGVYMVQKVGLRSILSDGSLSYYDSGNDCNEPSGAGTIFIGTSSTAPAAFGSAVDRSGATNYTASISNQYLGAGALYKVGNFGKGSAVNSSLRSMGVGPAASSTSNTGAVFVFNANQAKGTDFILAIKVLYTWS